MADQVPSLMADKLATLMNSWSSIELRVHVDSTNRLDKISGEGDEVYIQTALGQRLYEQSWPGAKPGNPNRKVEYADGKRFAESSWTNDRQENVIYKSSFSNEAKTALGQRPAPLKYLYLQHQPLAKSLLKAEYIGQDRRLGRDCEVLLLKGVKWTYSPVEIVYYLDRETAFPLEVRCFDPGADRERDQPQWSWEAKTFDRVEGGRYWPMRSVESTFNPDPSGAIKLHKTRENQVKTIHFNKPYPESIFLPKEEPGTTVLDSVQHTHRIVPAAKKADESSVKTMVPATEPILATRPSDWTATASSAGLILGLVLVTVGGASWWWRRP